MPYLTNERRTQLAVGWFDSSEQTPGDLNYLITCEVIDWLGESPNYERYNAAIGALECAKLELYRRAVAPYEESKCAENGDVY
jgi:hypothetical protein